MTEYIRAEQMARNPRISRQADKMLAQADGPQ